MIFNLTVKNITTLKANISHKSGITWQPWGPPVSHATRTLTKSTPGLDRKITKPIRNQTSGKELGRGIRRTAIETIRNVAKSKRPGRGNGGILSEFVNKWSIISLDMVDRLPG